MARAKQAEIPGTERPKVAEVGAAAEAYVDARDKRMKLTDKEKGAKDALVAVMKKHSLSVYRDDSASLVVTLVQGKDGVKVETIDEPGEDEGGE